MIVCICANVNCRSIRQAIEQGADTVDTLTMKTGACSGCGQCRQACQGYLDAHHSDQSIHLSSPPVVDFNRNDNLRSAF